MANYFLTETAQFKPFSYQEMLAPIMALKEDYEKTEKELSDLEDTAAAQAFTFQGSAYENDYNKYIESLNNASNNMSIGNYNSDTKNQIKALRKQFLNTLAPAAQRITKLNTLRDKQNAEQAANPFIRFTTDYRNANEKDITANSNYTSYDLSKIYEQVAKDTLSRIASDYRPQVGDPTHIKGTNSYIVKHGYGMTQDEYNKALNTPDSDLNKFIASEVKKATNGITNQDVIDEVTIGVQNTIKSNIGKFEQITVKGDTTSMSDLFREAEFNYKYTIDPVTKEIRLSDRYQMDRGYTKNSDGSWSPPSQNSQTTYQAGPQNPITLNADELTNMLGVQNFWVSRSGEVKKSKEFDKIKNKASLEEIRGNKTYSGKKFDPNNEDELEKDSLVRRWIIDTVGENNINNYMYLYNEDTGEVHILPQKQHKITDDTLPQEAQPVKVKQPSSTDEDGE